MGRRKSKNMNERGKAPPARAEGPGNEHDVLSDEELLARTEAGEREAFDEIIRRYQDRVYNLLLRLCGKVEDADDLTQETFVKAYRGLKNFRWRSRFYTWLFQIAVNAAFSLKRKQGRRKKVEGASLDGLGWNPGKDGDGGTARENFPAVSVEPDPAEEVERQEVCLRVRRELNELEPERRVVLLLCDAEGLSYDEAAETLGVSRTTVKSRLYRARAALAGRLKDLRP